MAHELLELILTAEVQILERKLRSQNASDIGHSADRLSSTERKALDLIQERRPLVIKALLEGSS